MLILNYLFYYFIVKILIYSLYNLLGIVNLFIFNFFEYYILFLEEWVNNLVDFLVNNFWFIF